MDEIEYKLKSNNSVIIVSAIEKLLSTIKSKYKPVDKHKFAYENEELKLLLEKCACKENVLSLTACQGILNLVESGVLDIGQTMSIMISLLPSAKNFSAIISTMGGLLVLDLRTRINPEKPYECQLSLKSPQHPFISVLEKNSEVARDVLSQMQAICLQPNNLIADNSLELLRAVFLWLICNPQESKSSEWKQSCWNLLLGLNQNRAQPLLVLECLCWQQFSSPKHCIAAYSIFSGLTEIAVQEKKNDYIVALVPVLARISTYFIQHSLDPRPCYNVINKCFSMDAPILRLSAGLTILLLSDNLSISPAMHLYDLLNLCLNILSKYEYPSIAINTFVAQSLQWLQYPSTLTAPVLKVASKIIEIQISQKSSEKLNMPTLFSNKIFKVLVQTDRKIFLYSRLLRTFERIKDEKSISLKWLEQIEGAEDCLRFDLVKFLLGMIMENSDNGGEVPVKALDLCLKVVKVRKDLAVTVLPILLFKLAMDTRPEVNLACIRAIPLMAYSKENVPVVVATLNKIKSGQGAPTSLLLHLFATLVDIQPRCYPYLQELLAEGSSTKSDVDVKWETDVAKALAVKNICETRAGAYGAELVSVLSGILNRCTDANGALASALALGALGALWRERVVSPASTWHALAPKMGRDKRPHVQIGLCKLLGEVPNLRVDTPEYDKFTREAARRLWSFIAESHNADVTMAACEALGNYRLEDFTLKDVPEVYRKNVKLPQSYCKTPADAARRPEDVLDYIPSEIWPNLFLNTNHAALSGVRSLCISYMDRELRGYRSGVYQQEGGGKTEPTSLSYLPPHSVVQGIMDYVRRQVWVVLTVKPRVWLWRRGRFGVATPGILQAVKPSYECPEAALLELFACMSRAYSRPLPPLDMCFLHELYHRGAHWRPACLQLAARQTQPSARRFLDNYLAAFQPDGANDSEIVLLFQILPHLCKSMPPNAIRSPVESCMHYAYNKCKGLRFTSNEEAKEVLMVQLLDLVRECLQDDRIHEANRTLLSQLVEHYLPLMDDDSVAWPAYLEVCTLLSTKYLERMTSPSSWWEVTGDLVRKAAAIRSKIASTADTECPLNWLNETIDAAVQCPTEHAFVLESMVPALKRAHFDEPTKDWLLQLMARTQIAISDDSNDELGLAFLCDVFLLSVTILSGYWCLETEGCEALVRSRDLLALLFPNAVAAATSHEKPKHWQDCAMQILEWLHRSRSLKKVPEQSREAFHYAIVACRSSPHFAKPNSWTKILSVKNPLSAST